MPAWVMTTVVNVLFKLGMVILVKFIPGLSNESKEAVVNYRRKKKDIKKKTKQKVLSDLTG